jgi:hypothetical protein
VKKFSMLIYVVLPLDVFDQFYWCLNTLINQSTTQSTIKPKTFKFQFRKSFICYSNDCSCLES